MASDVMMTVEHRLPLVSSLLRVALLVGLGSFVACGERSRPLPPVEPGSLISMAFAVKAIGQLKEDGIHVLVSVDSKGWQDLPVRRRLVVKTQDGKVVFETAVSGTQGDGAPPPRGPWEFVVDASTTKLQCEMEQFDEAGQRMGSVSQELAVDSTKDPVLSDAVSDFLQEYHPNSPGAAAPRTK